MAKAAKYVPMVWSPAQAERLYAEADLGLSVAEIEYRTKFPKRDINARLKMDEAEVNPSRIAAIRRAGKKRTIFLREDVGGVIGLRWLCAHRSGAAFDVEKCEALMAAGVLVEVEKGRPGQYMWALLRMDAA